MPCSYRFEDLKTYATAESVARDFLGARIGSDHRCAAVWRGGDGNNVQFYSDGSFKDFRSGDHGDGVDLYCIAKGVDREAANNDLGDFYCPHLRQERRTRGGTRQARPAAPPPARPLFSVPTAPQTPPPPPPEVRETTPAAQPAKTAHGFSVLPGGAKNQYDTLVHEGYTDTPYYYQDMQGNVVITVHRMDKLGFPKQIIQESTQYGWSVKDVPSILYHQNYLPAARRVYVCEGEKCADAVISVIPAEAKATATTNSGGARKWRPEFADMFVGKEVVVFADNDDAGREHAQIVAESLAYCAKWVRVIVPGTAPKEDIADCIYRRGISYDQIEQMVASAGAYLPRFAFSVTESMIQDAKELNAAPFCNFRVVDDGGRQSRRLREMSDMLAEIRRRFLGFPCCLGDDVLFDRDRASGRIRYLHDSARLIAWINSCDHFNTVWDKAMDKREFLEYMKINVRHYDTISGTPHCPPKHSVFYNCPAIMPPSKDYGVFGRFLEFFNPADADSSVFLRAFFMAPMWGLRNFARPCWVIDSVSGAGVGKTTLVSMLARLYNEQAMDFRQADMGEKLMSETKKRIVSKEGRASHILLLDNVEGVFDSDMFASLVTADSISARPAYGTDEVWRENDITYVITMNNAKLSDDMSRRSYFIDLEKSQKGYTLWKEKVAEYLDANRSQIISDIYNILATPNRAVWDTSSRFPEFSRDILQRACADEATFRSALAFLERKQRDTNVNLVHLPNIITEVRGRLYDQKVVADDEYVFIHSRVINDWLEDIEGRCFHVANLVDFVRNSQTDNFTEDMQQLVNAKGTPVMNGILWIGDNACGKRPVKIVQMEGRTIKVVDCLHDGEVIYYERRPKC